MDQQHHTSQTDEHHTGGHQNFLQEMETFFDLYLHKKAPFQIPPRGREWIVQFSPWITIVLMIIAIPVILFLIGLHAVISPISSFYAGYHYGFSYIIWGLFTLATFILELVAVPGLFNRLLKAWHLVYYATLINIVGQLISGRIFDAIIGGAISLYILFQIKEYYK